MIIKKQDGYDFIVESLKFVTEYLGLFAFYVIITDSDA